MRKVKVLALLLAALMVVAVFAGCADTDAIVADVENLDERVEALENLLNNQKDAIDDMKDQLGDVSDKLDNDTTADQLAQVIEQLKQQQAANEELKEQLKELGDKVTKVEEDTEGADDDAALEAAVKLYTAQLQELKITCELSKDDYVPADYTAVVKALSDAIVAIADAEKAADVEKLYNDAKAIYDTKATVYSKLINYYNTVRNAITADSKDLVAEITVFLDGDAVNLIPSAVNTVYPTIGADHKVANYKNGDKNADGTDVKINLVTELRNAIAAYNYLVGTTFKNNVANAIAKIKAIDVVTIDTAGINAVSAAKTAYGVVANEVNGLTSVNAKYIADSALALVTNAADLTAAEARLNQLTVAKAMYDTLGAVSDGSVASPFKAYKDLGTVKVDYQKKNKYDAIDNVLAAWINAYTLEDKNVAIIVDAKEGVTGFYETYKADRHETALCVKAFTDFAAIANKIAALNKVTTVAASALTEYKAVVDAIEAWKVLQKDDATTPLVNEKIVIDDYNFNLILAAYGFDATATDADMTKATFYYGLYDFVDTAVDTFFATQYASIDAEVKAINDNIKELKANLTAGTKYTDIARHLELEGLYADADKNGTYTKVTVTKDDKALKANGLKKDSLTIAAFTKKYEAYDLTSLLNLADFEAAKAGAIERIAGFKAGAENIAKLVEAIDYVELKAGANAYDFSVPADSDTVYYYVNLSDAEAIDAANKAYTAWINAGANSSLAEWVPYVDPTTEKVVPDTYEFVTIADADVLAALKQMNERVATLKSMAAKLVAHYELVAEVWNAVSAKVTLASDLNTADKNVLELHKATLDAGYTVTMGANKVPGVIPVAVSSASANSFSYNGKTYELAAKGSATDVTTAAAASDSLLTLIQKGNDAYEAFMVMNRDVTIKADKSGVSPSYVKDSAVEAAVKGIAAAELVMVKDVALDAVAKATTLTEGQKAQYTEWLNGATAVHGYTGTTVWVYAQQIYAQSTLRINAIQRGTEVVDDGKADTNKTAANVFTAPSYDNIG